jgi:putative inorganic carbon (HCO3(-)) transporter
VKDIQIHIPGKSSEGLSRVEKLRALFDRKLTGLVILLLISLAFGALIAFQGIIAGAGILALMFGPPAVYCIVAFPEFGITVLLIFAYLLFFIGRLGVNFPLGTPAQLEGFQGAYQRYDPDLDCF